MVETLGLAVANEIMSTVQAHATLEGTGFSGLDKALRSSKASWSTVGESSLSPRSSSRSKIVVVESRVSGVLRAPTFSA